MKRTFILSYMLLLCAFLVNAQSKSLQVACGDWIELSATAYEDYHFVEWNDGNTDSIRQVQINRDEHFIAYFAANCEEYANWPLVEYYDWLLMLDVRQVNQMGYNVSSNHVTWYRVVGEPDDMHNVFPVDDEMVCRGYYLTIDRNLYGTGDYYCVADVSDNQGVLCDGLMRSRIAHYAGSGRKTNLSLLPTRVERGGEMVLRGLIQDETSQLTVYTASGQIIQRLAAQGEDTYRWNAPLMVGCYIVLVQSPTYNETLRFIVTQ